MSEHAYGWGFYGRKKELDKLRRWMSSPMFTTVAVVGGRGVGKTELIKKAARTIGDQKPYIYLELPEIKGEDSEFDRLERMRNVNIKLAEQARTEEVADVSPPPASSSDYVIHMRYFANSLESLLRHGVVTVLDEFQNSRKLLLESDVKALIDKLNIERNDSGGAVVVAGSHQQKMLKMLFGVTEPMYGRADMTLRLYPLKAPDVLEMAAAQGWLSKPNRFLTAYTAFGGNPRLWRRFAREVLSGELPEPADGGDKSWQDGFMSQQIRRFTSDRSESFFNAAYINLSAEARKVALKIAENPRGVRWSQIVQQYGGAPEEASSNAELGFDFLQSHLGIAEFVPISGQASESARKARLTDQAALFELHMTKGLRKTKVDNSMEESEIRMHKMSDMEGMALERLAAEWLGGFRLFEVVQRSAEIAGPSGKHLEIDVIAETSYPYTGKRYIAMCSCKRNFQRHQIKKTSEEFDLYLGLRESEGDKWESDCVKRYLFSPSWPEAALQNDGFERFSFASMAGNLGFTIKPWPHIPEPEPSSEAVPDQMTERQESELRANDIGSDGLDLEM